MGQRLVRALAALGCIAAGGLIVADLLDYMPGRQTYWDHQVRELCEKDGGIVVLEQVRIAKGESTAVEIKARADPASAVYAQTGTATTLREGNPSVWRSEWHVVRRSDQAIVARAIQYSRAGGDFPTASEPSWFGCPDSSKMSADMQRLFVVQE
jgi:hypothetical protein